MSIQIFDLIARQAQEPDLQSKTMATCRLDI